MLALNTVPDTSISLASEVKEDITQCKTCCLTRYRNRGQRKQHLSCLGKGIYLEGAVMKE